MRPPGLDTLLLDLRYTARIIKRSPGFTAAAVLALGLGIGVNTAIFTAYKAMVARPPDAFRSREMVNLSLVHQSGTPSFTFSYPDYQAYRDSVRSFSGLIAFSPEHMRFSHSFRSRRTDKPVLVSVFAISRNYFRVLGKAPVRGRGFDAGKLAALPALISENCWEKRFARDSAILGRTIYLNGVGFTIIGITARLRGHQRSRPGFLDLTRDRTPSSFRPQLVERSRKRGLSSLRAPSAGSDNRACASRDEFVRKPPASSP